MRQFKSDKVYKLFKEDLFDDTGKDLLKLAKQTPGFVRRSKDQILTYYQKTSKSGVVEFITPSGTTPGLYWKQKIKLVDLAYHIKKYKNKKKPIEIVRMAIKGNLKVSCNDPTGGDEPSYLYWGFKYKGSIQGYHFGKKEDRYPEVRNPKLKGSVCKHLHAALSNLPFHANVITRDLVKTGVFEP